MLNGYFIEKEVQQRAAALERRLARVPALQCRGASVRERLAAGLVTPAHRVDPQHVASAPAPVLPAATGWRPERTVSPHSGETAGTTARLVG